MHFKNKKHGTMFSQIESKKLDWHVGSKVGSLDNAQHKPGGGEKKVKLDNYNKLLV